MFEILTNSLFYLTLAVVIGLGLLVTLFVLVRDVLTRLSGSGLILLLGLLFVFFGERWMGEGTARWVFSGGGLLIVAASLGLRAYAMGRATDEARRRAHRQGLLLGGLVVLGLVLYGITLDAVVDALGLGEEAAERWVAVWRSLSPIAVVAGVLPTLSLDRTLSRHPVAIPRGAVQRAVVSGAASALAIALVVPVNYLADHYDKGWDLAYFRTTRAGSSTQNIVRSLPEPVTVTLFYPAGNDTLREIEPYFDTLVQAAGGQLTVRAVDQALDPALAEELGVRDNGYIALTMGDNTEKFKLDTDIERAKRDLKKLDQTVRKHLIKLSRGQRVVYWLVGHGEASHKERDDVFRKLSLLKRGIFDAENLKVKEFGVTSGSTDEVPDDAALVVVAAPRKDLLPEEVDALTRYLDRGGRMLILKDDAEEGADPVGPLLAHLGVQAGDALLANEQAYLAVQGRSAMSSRVNLVTNKFGTHESVKTLSRNASQLAVILFGARQVHKAPGAKAKVSTLVRTLPDTFEDLDGNYALSEGEQKKVYELAVAVSGDKQGEGDDAKQMRAVVVGDVSLFADLVLQRSQGNAVFARDTLLWLLDDLEAQGEVESEEDVQIVHTNEEDVAWFAMTVFGIPILVGAFGVALVRLRGRKA